MFNLSFLSRSFYYFPFTLDVLKFHCDVTWYIFIFIFSCFIIRVHFQPEWRFFDSLSILENSIITFFNIVFHSNFHLVLDFLLNIQWIISVHPPWFLTALLYFYLFVSVLCFDECFSTFSLSTIPQNVQNVQNCDFLPSLYPHSKPSLPMLFISVIGITICQISWFLLLPGYWLLIFCTIRVILK